MADDLKIFSLESLLYFPGRLFMFVFIEFARHVFIFCSDAVVLRIIFHF